ncbi:MAG: hypothetical protein ABH810_01365 [bacterium]
MFLGIFIAITVLYGFMMQRDKIMSALLACYMGMVIVSVWAEPIKQFFEGKKTLANTWIQSDASPATIKIVLFLIVVSLVAAKADIALGRERSLSAPIETLFYSAITAILLAGTVFKYLPNATQAQIISQTNFVHYLKDYYTFFLIAPIVVIVVLSSRRRGY